MAQPKVLAECYCQMHEAYRKMPEEEKEEFRAWERKNVKPQGNLGSSDWPGWTEYMGPKQVESGLPAMGPNAG